MRFCQDFMHFWQEILHFGRNLCIFGRKNNLVGNYVFLVGNYAFLVGRLYISFLKLVFTWFKIVHTKSFLFIPCWTLQTEILFLGPKRNMLDDCMRSSLFLSKLYICFILNVQIFERRHCLFSTNTQKASTASSSKTPFFKIKSFTIAFQFLLKSTTSKEPHKSCWKIMHCSVDV